MIAAVLIVSMMPVFSVDVGSGMAIGNRVAGVVYSKDEKPIPIGKVVVEGYENRLTDATNDDGLFVLDIDKSIRSYRLLMLARGFHPLRTDPINNDADPTKLQRVYMQRLEPTLDARNPRAFEQALRESKQIFDLLESDELKEELARNYSEYFADVKSENLNSPAIASTIADYSGVFDARLDPSSLFGRWEIIAAVQGGEEATEEFTDGSIEITKQMFFLASNAESDFEMSYSVNDWQYPAKIDLTMKNNNVQSKALGIIDVVGDRLTVCFDPTGENRPTKFESNEEQGFLLLNAIRPESKKDNEK